MVRSIISISTRYIVDCRDIHSLKYDASHTGYSRTIYIAQAWSSNTNENEYVGTHKFSILMILNTVFDMFDMFVWYDCRYILFVVSSRVDAFYQTSCCHITENPIRKLHVTACNQLTQATWWFSFILPSVFVQWQFIRIWWERLKQMCSLLCY